VETPRVRQVELGGCFDLRLVVARTVNLCDAPTRYRYSVARSGGGREAVPAHSAPVDRGGPDIQHLPLDGSDG
jgi:hypothetical protein